MQYKIISLKILLSLLPFLIYLLGIIDAYIFVLKKVW